MSLQFGIKHPADLYEPRRAIRDLAAKSGFTSQDGQELAIVVSELISNILKYGVRGSIELELLEDAKPGIRIVARDEGPPFHDLQLALKDGWNDRGPIDPASLLRRGGLGTGLGAIVRLSDSFHVDHLPSGKAIHVVRYRARGRRRS
ncbi:MAG TPA: ATP-binding protein [Polyangiales bacterium]|nr:ATP-binding protein [Polyangiales bacterium]